MQMFSVLFESSVSFLYFTNGNKVITYRNTAQPPAVQPLAAAGRAAADPRRAVVSWPVASPDGAAGAGVVDWHGRASRSP